MHLIARAPLLFALACTATAQTFDLQEAHGVAHDDHGVPWLLGCDYKASFADGALTFVPALGRAAATNRSLTLQLLAIERGESVVLDATTSPASVKSGEQHVAIVRGDVTERYDARVDGVEQSFVFATPPAGHGDLVVRCAVATALAVATRDDGTLFCHDGRTGGVTIGTVTGIDAAQRRCPGSLSLQDGMLELRLPAAFVDTAAYPLTLDPLLATGSLIGDSFDNDDTVDAAHGAIDGTTLVVFRRTFSYFDQDIRAQRVAADGSLVGAVLSITLTPTNEGQPAVCYVNFRNRHVVCWNEAPVPFGPWTLRARSVSGSTLGTAISVSGSAGGSDTTVSLCGDRSFTGTKALVAWKGAPGGSADIFTTTLDVGATGTLVAALPYNVTGTASMPVSTNFQLARSRVPNAMVVLGITQDFFTVSHSALPLNYDGQVVGTPMAFAIAAAGVATAFAIDGDGIDHLGVWRTASGTLEARPITWNGTVLSLGTPATISATAGLAMATGFLGERFVVTWAEPTPNPFDNDLRGIALKPDCAVCSEPFTLATVARPNALSPLVAPAFAGASAQGKALLAWDETNITTPFRGSVVGQHFAAMVGLPAMLLSAGCGNGGTASAIGPFAPGNEAFSFNLSGGDATAPYAILSLNLGAPPVLCGCELTDPLATVVMVANNGSARFTFLPWCDPQFLGTQIEFQWLLYGAAASPCPLVPTLVASNRMLVTLQP